MVGCDKGKALNGDQVSQDLISSVPFNSFSCFSYLYKPHLYGLQITCLQN